jgi:2-methylcitrate dehydratase PrpD
MSQAPESHGHDPEITKTLADYTMGLKYEDLSDEAIEAAKHCLLDWIGVTLAGLEEPLTHMLIEQAVADGGAAQATVVGDGRKVSTSQAALINGSASHALDYDDVQTRLQGHPTVPVAPVVLALGERDGRSGKDVLIAFAAGVDAECRVGAYMGMTHYEKGWHSTATIGTFGAAVGAAHLMGLDGEKCSLAMGIAGTQAAGLKSMFGTMCKPLHAGKAAQNGLFAANMAARGFTSRPDVLERHQGFAHTQSEAPNIEAGLFGLGERFEVRDTLFKYHAACYGTHGTIEAIHAMQKKAEIDQSNIERIEVAVRTGFLDVCGIPTPTTGLEGKFSLRFCAAIAIAGEDTARLETYSDENVYNPVLVELFQKVVVSEKDTLERMEAEVTIHTKDGVVHYEKYDAGIPAADLSAQWEKLVKKFRGCSEPVIGKEKTEKLIETLARLETLDDISDLMVDCS